MANKIKKIGIVISRFNEDITDNLLKSSLATLKKGGFPLSRIKVVRVPGAYEIPFIANEMARSKKFSAILALGCIIKGETSHDVHIASWVSTGIGMASLQNRIPILFGILTPHTEAQARKRSRPGPLNRGREVAQAALEMLHLTSKGLK